MFTWISALALRRLARRWLPLACIPLVAALALGVLALRAQPHPVAAIVPTASPSATPSDAIVATPGDTPTDRATATATPTDTPATPRAAPTPTPIAATGESALLVPCGGDSTTGFGRSVAMTPDGTEVVVGADDINNEGTGAVYVLVGAGGGWAQQARLTAGDASQNAAFGYAVAVSADGSTILVGATFAGGDGKAYVFTRSGAGWSEAAEFGANDGRTFGDAFGSAVSLSADGRTALVSRPGYSWPSMAYVFTNHGSWALTATLKAAAPQENDGFGAASALAPTGSRLVLGAPRESKAYVYDLSGGGWTVSAALSVPGSSFLGREVAISGDGNTVLAADSGFYSAGSVVHAFHFSGGGWTDAGVLSASANGNGGFGIGLALSADGGRAVVGDYGPSQTRGSAFLFAAGSGTWSVSRQLVNPVPADYDGYGSAVALSSDASVIAVAVPLRNNPGAVAIFDARHVGPPQTVHC